MNIENFNGHRSWSWGSRRVLLFNKEKEAIYLMTILLLSQLVNPASGENDVLINVPNEMS